MKMDKTSWTYCIKLPLSLYCCKSLVYTPFGTSWKMIHDPDSITDDDIHCQPGTENTLSLGCLDPPTPLDSLLLLDGCSTVKEGNLAWLITGESSLTGQNPLSIELSAFTLARLSFDRRLLNSSTLSAMEGRWERLEVPTRTGLVRVTSSLGCGCTAALPMGSAPSPGS